MSEVAVSKMRSALSGRTLPQEVKEKISKIKTGVKFTVEHCKAISESRKGIVFSEEHKSNLKASKQVLAKPMVVEGKEYATLSEASIGLNLSISAIHRRLNSVDEKFENWKYL